MRLCEYNDSLIHIPTQELVRERFTVSTIHNPNDDERGAYFVVWHWMDVGNLCGIVGKCVVLSPPHYDEVLF